MTQLEFDLFEPAPVIETVLACEFCGEESPSSFAHDINHQLMHGVCSKAWILLNHCRAIARGVPREIGKPGNCFADDCTDHYRGEWVRKLPESCIRREYEQKRAWLISAGVSVGEIPVAEFSGEVAG